MDEQLRTRLIDEVATALHSRTCDCGGYGGVNWDDAAAVVDALHIEHYQTRTIIPASGDDAPTSFPVFRIGAAEAD